jgi:hypothetical protein
MVATRRNYTRDEKAAYQRRLDRRYIESARRSTYRTVSEIAAHAVVTMNQAAPELAAAFGGVRESAQKMAHAFMDLNVTGRMGLRGPSADCVIVDELASMPDQFIHTRGPQEGQPISAEQQLPTVEQLLGMDPATPRPQTLENMLDLPPAPIRQKTLPEEWIQS